MLSIMGIKSRLLCLTGNMIFRSTANSAKMQPKPPCPRPPGSVVHQDFQAPVEMRRPGNGVLSLNPFEQLGAGPKQRERPVNHAKANFGRRQKLARDFSSSLS
jgi:hypothetical protein